MNTVPTSIPRSSHRMSEEERTGSSSTPLKTVSSAPGAHQASHSSTTGAKVRTLQDVQRDIQKESVEYDQAMAKFEDALSAYESALAACNKDPNDKVLSKELADAKYSRDSYKCLLDISAQFLASLEPERARLQAAADASSEQKSKFLLCVYSPLCFYVCLEGFCMVFLLFTGHFVALSTILPNFASLTACTPSIPCFCDRSLSSHAEAVYSQLPPAARCQW